MPKRKPNDLFSTFFTNKYYVLIELLIIFLIFFVWKFGIGVPSSYTDLSYHLATAQGFSRAGGIVTWDFWESLPIGRPHNYPPLFHLLLGSLLKMGLNPSTAIKVMMELTVAGGILAYAYGLIKLFNAKISFWATFLLTFSFHFIQLSLTVMPATIVVFLTPLLFYFLLEKKWMSYCLTLVLAFYLHLFIPYLILVSLMFYLLIFDRNLLKRAILPTIISFLMFCPWLIHIFSGGWQYIKYLNPESIEDLWRSFVSINLVVILLFVSGALLLFIKRPALNNKYFLFLLSGAIILSPSLLIASRIIDGHFLPFAVVLCALAITLISQSRKMLAKFSLIVFVLFYIWWNPTIRLGTGIKFNLMDSPLKYFFNKNLPDKDPLVKYNALISPLRINSSRGESISSALTSFNDYPVDKNYNLSISNLFASYAGLSTLNLRQPEIYSRPYPELNKSKFLLINSSILSLPSSYFGDQPNPSRQAIADSIKQNFTQLSSIQDGEDNYINLYENKTNNFYREALPKNHFPFWLADTLVLLSVALFVIDMKKYEKS